MSCLVPLITLTKRIKKNFPTYQPEKMKKNKSGTDFFLGLKLTMVTVPGDLFSINK